MTVTEASRPGTVDRFWSRVSTDPQGAHAYVSLLGLRTFETARLHARVRQGLSYEAFERLRRVLDLPASRAAQLLQIPTRTLARRKEARKFEPEESDRLIRLSRLVGLALQLFEGDLDEMRSWLTTTHTALAHHTPLEFATTEIGSREVENLMGRLEHGIPL
ncbi:MAG: antitoxin Xre-like helix-turn-helix domain-containing protein [Gemmatimonadota bacterium]